MDKKLPHIYANDNISSNNRRFYYSTQDNSRNIVKENNNVERTEKEKFLDKYNLTETIKSNNINSKIINIFKHSNSIYKVKVKIKINGEENIKYLIGRTNKTLIALDGEVINIDEIDDIDVSD